jgi:hypothetical protein
LKKTNFCEFDAKLSSGMVNMGAELHSEAEHNRLGVGVLFIRQIIQKNRNMMFRV